MYDETHYFDPHNPHQMPGSEIDGTSQTATNCSVLPQFMGVCSNMNSHSNSLEQNFRQISNLSLEDLPNHHNPSTGAATGAVANMGIDLQQQFGYEMEQEFNNNLMQQVIHDSNSVHLDQPNWESGVQEMQDMSFHHNSQQEQPQHYHLQHVQEQQQIEMHENMQCLNSTPFGNPPYAATPDLLNLLHLPRCSAMNSSIPFTNTGNKLGNLNNSFDHLGELPASDSSSASTVLYDPSLHLNLPPQPLFRELFLSLPNNYNLSLSKGGSLFGGMDEREGTGGYQIGDGRQIENTVLDFRRELNNLGKGVEKGTNHFATERQRREQLNEKYQELKELVPNPTKPDRASVVGDAIDYIKELLRTVEELKILVEQKRCGGDRSKRPRTEDDTSKDMENPSMKPLGTDREHSFNGSLRSSWLQRKSKDTEVDVRIIDNEVTIKLIQRKRMNCLLFVSKILDELQLDLLHVAGGNIGDYYSFLFNTKIYEGSSVYASAIAKKLIEVVERQTAAFPLIKPNL